MPRHSLDRELPILREAIENLGPSTQKRYPKELGQKIERYGRARLAAGASQTAICEELGIGSPTFKRLLVGGNKESVPLKRVRIDNRIGAATASLTVRGPNGVVIEGLDLNGVADLLRALA